MPRARVLAEVDLVGLHLAGEDQGRFFRILLVLLVARINQFPQPLLEAREAFKERVAPLVGGLGRGLPGRVGGGWRGLLGAEGLEFPLQSPDVALELLDDRRRRRNLLCDHRNLRRGGRRERDQARRRDRPGYRQD